MRCPPVAHGVTGLPAVGGPLCQSRGGMGGAIVCLVCRHHFRAVRGVGCHRGAPAHRTRVKVRRRVIICMCISAPAAHWDRTPGRSFHITFDGIFQCQTSRAHRRQQAAGVRCLESLLPKEVIREMKAAERHLDALRPAPVLTAGECICRMRVGELEELFPLPKPARWAGLTCCRSASTPHPSRVSRALIPYC
jgi:hypothetical protein